jgi:2-keto-4-pentenoate hydratase/2-oxohepta-3-ene-1,7-dioic acid hydratase in catechol pathway
MMTDMIQLVSYKSRQTVKTGLMLDGKIYASARYDNAQEVLDDWNSASVRLRDLAPKLRQSEPEHDVQLLSPLLSPRNIYFAGANYVDHVQEMKQTLGLALEEDPKGKGVPPWHSIKATGSGVAGPAAKIGRPINCTKLDWELELAVVIGKSCKNVSTSDALTYVAGYTIANDLSARDLFARANVHSVSPFHYDWIGQKSFDGACVLGPAITPSYWIADPQILQMQLWVNGELMQSSHTGQMIYSVAEQVSFLSQRITLIPGDVILTGTPAGVGMAKNKFLVPGDRIRQAIEHIGEFEFSIA